MPPKPEPAKRFVTHSQSKAKTQVAQTQTDSKFLWFFLTHDIGYLS